MLAVTNTVMALVIIKYCLQVITCHDISFPTPLITVTVVVFSATFYNISAISWRSVLLVEETVITIVKL